MCTVQQPSGTQRVVLSMESHTLHVKLGSFGPNLHAHWTHSVSCHDVQFALESKAGKGMNKMTSSITVFKATEPKVYLL